MMDLRKIDKGQMQLHMAETDLVAFIDDLYGLFSHQARAKRISLRFEHDEGALPVWIDRRHFDKVIVNLLSNAMKFTPIGGEIVIRLSKGGNPAAVQISISDNGEKIPEDKLEKIFERFYQATSATNERTSGTGIGLDLTRSLVELHHGTITAHNLEQGCEFVVTLPLGNSHLRADEMEPDTQTGAANDPFEALGAADSAAEASADDIDQALVQMQGDAGGGRERVVIAEDDDEIREYLASELGGDYDVTACVNGREALAAVLRLQPAVVITDVMMPELDGNALCSQLKSNAQTNDIPIIMLTAKSRDEDRLESLETGADAYIVKPFNMDILRRTVVNLMGHQQLLRMKYGRIEPLEQQIDEVQVKTADEKLLERIMASINRHLDDSDLNIDMLSEEAGISRVHLHRKMKELTGQTPHDFIRSIRLKRAARLLATQGMSVTEVMYACGFASIASFSTVFKRFYGMTPTDYIKASREKDGEG